MESPREHSTDDYAQSRRFFTTRFVDPVVSSMATPEVLQMARSLKSLCLIELFLACVVALFFNYSIVISIIPTDALGVYACTYLRKQMLLLFCIMKLFGVVMWVWMSSSLEGLWTSTFYIPFSVVVIVVLFYQMVCCSVARRLYMTLTLLEARDEVNLELAAAEHLDEESNGNSGVSQLSSDQAPQQKFMPAEPYLPTEYFTPGQAAPYPPYNYYPQYTAVPTSNGFPYAQGMPPPHLTGYPMMVPYPPTPVPAPSSSAANDTQVPADSAAQPSYVVAAEPVPSPKSSDRDALL